MAHYYERDVITLEGSSYVCILEHDASSVTRPKTGASWETYWQLLAQGLYVVGKWELS